MYFTKTRVLNYFTPGLRLWSNQIPLRFDPYSGCSNRCLYCYASQVQEGALCRLSLKYNPRILKVGNVNKIRKDCVNIFDNKQMDKYSHMDFWLANRGIFECGTMGDPFMHEEIDFNNTYNLMNVAQQYRLPLYINSKLNALVESKRHFDMVCELKKTGIIIDATLSSNNNKLLRKFEPKAPSVEERIKVISSLADNNVDVVVSARPIIKGVTDDNFESYIEDMCNTGASSIHLRTLIISGKQLAKPFWKKYTKEAGMVFKDVSYRYPMSYFTQLFNEAEDVAKGYGVKITGSHHLFFKFGTSNKCDYSRTSKAVQNGLFQPGITEILSDVYNHKSEPKVLYFDDLMKPQIKKHKYYMDNEFRINSLTAVLIWASSCTHKIPNPFLLTGKEIFTNGLWNGWESGVDRKVQKLRIPYLSTIEQMFIVVNNKGEDVKDDEGNLIYAYIPEEMMNKVETSHEFKYPTIKRKTLKEMDLW